ncbi:putative preprotein translocase, SecE subunit [Gottschalkia purinilytica]|uniref:Protein translocase subunit SecE n=1 Tax=Gottschalkia purinilytica TaxID=1503 RepID=A0A0L0W9M3_GOTPU|nr:preprotein translocase subunit SecE [Gottschalkia purinilytica]KNF08005.1 putative preprotein translocase, SecE subunit [Gottschalkia purinilytica]
MSAQTNTEKGMNKRAGFFKGVKAELKKVTWPTKKELINDTIIVLVMCTIVSLIVWLIDTGLHRLLSLILR